MTDRDEEKIICALRAGRSVEWIAEEFEASRSAVIQLGLDNLMTLDVKADVMKQRETTADSEAALLARTAAYADKTTQRLRTRVFDALDALRERVALVAEEESERAQAAKAKAQLLARKERLRAELAELDEQLRPLSKVRAVKAPAIERSKPPAKVVRAWAFANGVPCSATARVPNATYEAYLAAHESVAS